ncbi:hypothetical protein RCL1_003566 [Eukaryota sp. TZLM3-RCL]
MFRGIDSTSSSDTEKVHLRRERLSSHCDNSSLTLANIPVSGLDYSSVHGRCCENVIGFVPVPVGIAGPLSVDQVDSLIPLATTEGCLVASVHRGCKAVTMSSTGGCRSSILRTGMTRAPVVRFPSIKNVNHFVSFLDSDEGQSIIQSVVNKSSRFLKFKEVRPFVSGRYVFLRFEFTTGDAMGMNMVTKACSEIIENLKPKFPEMEYLVVSGNLCTDKKPSSVNWVLGRGRSVVVEAEISKNVVENILHTSVSRLVEINHVKNFMGSALAGSIGGFNAHAANIVAAVFAACGQDLAQVVDSSMCLTQMEALENGNLYMSVTLPCMEVGVVGGGTCLAAQSECIKIMIGQEDSDRSGRLASCVGAAVLAGELSLMGALAADHLTRAHMALNRKS